MRLCVISDIHGNFESLRAALKRLKAKGLDMILIAGDLAAHGPRPAETLAELQALDHASVICGNTDYLVDPTTTPIGNWPPNEVPERLRSLEWTRKQLGGEGLEFLAGLPSEAEVDGCLLVHGSAGSDERGIFPTTPLVAFDTPAWSCVLACGHTHVPFHRSFGVRHLVNSGSVAWNVINDLEARHVPWRENVRRFIEAGRAG